MSRNLLSKEEAINQLYATIKTKFQQDGILQEVRCFLQAKMVAMMKGKSETTTLVQRPHASPSSDADADADVNATGDARMALLHQLIMEYLQWHGFHYSAQMFAQESACEMARPVHECFEAILGNFEHKSVPVLLQLVTNKMEKHNASPHHQHQQHHYERDNSNNNNQ